MAAVGLFEHDGVDRGPAADVAGSGPGEGERDALGGGCDQGVLEAVREERGRSVVSHVRCHTRRLDLGGVAQLVVGCGAVEESAHQVGCPAAACPKVARSLTPTKSSTPSTRGEIRARSWGSVGSTNTPGVVAASA